MLGHWRWLVLVVLVMLPGLGMPGPVKGPLRETRLNLPAGFPGTVEVPPLSFVGGQPACVILVGDHNPVVDLGIKVYDDEDRLVAQDAGKGDYAAVTWYPPQTANYKIVLENNQADFNRCYLVIK